MTTIGSTYKEIAALLQKHADNKRKKASMRFFKTQKGQYGHGDKFIGIAVPLLRKIAKQYKNTSIKTILKLLHNPIHEYRFIALVILIQKYKQAKNLRKQKIVRLYLKNTKFINNWDLVDISAHHILGSYLLNSKPSPLYRLAKSSFLWEKRIAIIATYAFIKRKIYVHTLSIARLLLSDTHDLIHKAVGWMLREVGKQDTDTLLTFLDTYANQMPRTTLRYAIERLVRKKQKHYLLIKPKKPRINL